MKRVIAGFLLSLFLTGPAFALSVCWDQVTTDTTGVPLGSGLQVTQYKLWKCNTPTASCLKPDATVIATVNAPFPALPSKVCSSINTQSIPSSFFATAVNVVTESQESGTIKAVGADKPRGEELRNP